MHWMMAPQEHDFTLCSKLNAEMKDNLVATAWELTNLTENCRRLKPAATMRLGATTGLWPQSLPDNSALSIDSKLWYEKATSQLHERHVRKILAARDRHVQLRDQLISLAASVPRKTDATTNAQDESQGKEQSGMNEGASRGVDRAARVSSRLGAMRGLIGRGSNLSDAASMFDPNPKVIETQTAADTRKAESIKAKLEGRPKLNVIERACLSLASDMSAENPITGSWTHSELANPSHRSI